MSFTFSEEAKRRIAEQGVSRISAFLDEVPLAQRQKIYARLPDVDGFQKKKNTPSHIQAKAKKLITAISHSTEPKARAVELDWFVFGAAWAVWAQKVVGERFPKPPFDFADADAGTCVLFLRTFVLVNDFPPCCREDLHTLVTFSGMRMSEGVLEVIASAPVRAEFDRQKKIFSLPDDISKVTSELAEIRRSISRQQLDIEAARSETRQVAKNSEEATRVTSRVAEAVEKLSSKGGAAGNEIFDDAIDRFESAQAQFAAQLEDIRKSLAREKTQIAKLDKSVGEVESRQKDIGLKFVQVEQRVEKSLAAPRAHEDIASVVQQHPGTLRTEQALDPNMRWLVPEAATSGVTELRGLAEAFKLIQDNLCAIGLLPSFAAGLARLSAAAIGAGLMPQYRGSVANIVAATIASSLGGEGLLGWHVSMGLYDESAALSAMSTLRPVASKGTCLLVRGANRSAFEIYGGPIKDNVVSRLFAADSTEEHGPIMVATWAEGPAVIPGGPPLLELGPIANVDGLQWKLTSGAERQKRGRVFFTPGEIHNIASVGSESTRDVTSLVDALGIGGNALWRRAFNRFSNILFGLSDPDFDRDFELALLGWILPWAKAQGCSRPLVEKAIRSFSIEHIDSPSVVTALDERSWEVEK
ncbi:hypothetical protein [Burkholderia sp. WSM2232]|uniref:hypothetical protein n=1 Tax=Burkholderia sp. WSM2232 TaxID=944436 RepID=UPI00041C0FB4|nr:hypothetical protein [Burkholderia sp. WSM2232]